MDADRKRVLIAEDHEVVGQGLKALLSPYFDILGPVRNGAEVIPAVRRDRPDAVVLDISMPGRNGLDILPDLTTEFPRMPVLMLTGSADVVVGRTAMLLGAMAFLPKDSGVEELELALRTVFHGRKYLSPRLPPAPMRNSPDLPPLPPSWSQLTPRQLRVLRLIAEGKDTEEMASTLGISVHTLRFHRNNLRKTLGVESEGGLLRIAMMFRVREELPAQ
jgi:DNA-binding NarL/FixJ family response regulator